MLTKLLLCVLHKRHALQREGGEGCVVAAGGGGSTCEEERAAAAAVTAAAAENSLAV